MADERPASIEERIQAINSPPPQDAPEAPAATEAPPAPEASLDAPEAPPAPEDAPEALEEAPEALQAVADDDAEIIEVDSLDGLAEHFGLDKADLYNLKVPVSIDGQRVDVSLSEWKDSYKSSQEAAQEARKAAEERQLMQQQRVQLEQQFEAKVRESAAALAVAEQQMMSDFKSVNWDALRHEDPAEWAATRQLFQERQNALDGAKQQLSQRWQQNQQQAIQEQQQQLVQHLETERQALVRAIPDWGNEETAKVERSALSDYLMGTGFTSDEVNQVYDHRLVAMARKAMLYDKSVAAADATKKRVVKIGKKTVKPGARRTAQEQRQDSISPLKANLRKSGKVEDAAALISARLQANR